MNKSALFFCPFTSIPEQEILPTRDCIHLILKPLVKRPACIVTCRLKAGITKPEDVAVASQQPVNMWDIAMQQPVNNNYDAVCSVQSILKLYNETNRKSH
jgi:hypothetical protein